MQRTQQRYLARVIQKMEAAWSTYQSAEVEQTNDPSTNNERGYQSLSLRAIKWGIDWVTEDQRSWNASYIVKEKVGNRNWIEKAKRDWTK